MRIEDLIKALQEYPPDMEVECLTSYEEVVFTREGLLTEVDYTWEPVTSVETYNQFGNVVRIK